MTQTNSRLPGVKRLLREAKELAEPTSQYYAYPLEDNIFEWHFSIRGPSQTSYEGGIYHGRIIFPTEYPIKPPEIIFLTPNGRFQPYKKICLSVSSYHPELWRPSWGVRTMLLAIIGFFPTPTEGAIGSTNIPEAEKIRLAQQSINWFCETCQKVNKDSLANIDDEESNIVAIEAKKLSGQIHIAQKDVEMDHSLEKDEIHTISEKENKNSNNIKISEFSEISKNSNELSFPWIKHDSFEIEKIILGDIFPFVESDLRCRSPPSMNFKFPKYDWRTENENEENAKKTHIEKSNEKEKLNQPEFIPNTRILQESAYNLRFHLRSSLMLIVYTVILVVLAKRLFHSALLLIDTLVD